MDIIKQLKEAVGSNKLIEPISRLNQLARTIDSLRGLLKDSKVSQSVKDRINGLMSLVTTRPNITGINHYFNHFLLRLDPDNQLPVLKDLLKAYHDRWKSVERKTAEVAYKHLFESLDPKGEPSVMLYGEEKSVEALFDILMVKQASVKIYQVLSRPKKTGKLQAKKLTENGFAVTVIDDIAAGAILPHVDFVLLGSEAILHEDFINTAGTHTLLAAARYYKRPVYVLADSRRILNAKYFPQNVLQALVGEGRPYNNDIWKDPPAGVVIQSNDKESIPNYLVDHFILEDGLHSPEALREQIDKVMVSKFF